MTSVYSGPKLSYLNAVTDQSRLWVPVSTMNAFVQAITNVSPSTVAGRQQILDAFNTLIPATPYAIADGAAITTNIRFSAVTNAGTPLVAAQFVATFRDGWSQLLATIQASCDFTARTSEKGINSSTPSAEIPDSNNMRSQYNDATYAVRKTVESMRTMLSTNVGVYNYQDFETAYQLTWSVTPEPPPFQIGRSPSKPTQKSAFSYETLAVLAMVTSGLPTKERSVMLSRFLVPAHEAGLLLEFNQLMLSPGDPADQQPTHSSMTPDKIH